MESIDESTMNKFRYKDFNLVPKTYYIIGVKKDRHSEDVQSFDDNVFEYYGIALLTRIDCIDNSTPNMRYFVLHFKHNKREFIQYYPLKYCWDHSECVCIEPWCTERGKVANSRFKITKDGNTYPSDGYINGGHKVTKSKLKCKDCTACRNGWYGKAGEYVCVGVSKPFVIKDIESECTEY